VAANDKNDKRVSVTLPRELRAQLMRRAHADLVSLSTAARQAIARAMAQERVERPQERDGGEDAA
jgi:hypothetical protein